MGHGLSPLQNDILAALGDWPLAGQAGSGLRNWARPVDLIDQLGLPHTNASRVAMTRSLRRLCDRGLVEAACGEIFTPGKGYRYLRKQLETPAERDRLLSQLCPEDRAMVERLMADHPTLTAARAIRDLTASGGL